MGPRGWIYRAIARCVVRRVAQPATMSFEMVWVSVVVAAFVAHAADGSMGSGGE